MLDFAVKEKKQDHSSTTSQPAFDPNASFIMPPPSVLWAWLSYVYQCTGEWPMPPAAKAVSVNSIDTGTTVAKVNNPPATIESKVGPTRPVPLPGTGPASFPIAYQLPIPAMLPYAPVAPTYKDATSTLRLRVEKNKTQQNKGSTSNITSFSYVNSIYFIEAERLISLYATRQIKADLIFGCKLVLTLILAWCHFPLFNGTAKREGKWMSLANERCTRELRIRAATFKEAVKELQEVGLITVGQVSSGIITREEFEQVRYECCCANAKPDSADFICNYWHPRSFQEKTHIYRLVATLQLSPSLPAFKPYPNDNINDQEGLVDILEQDHKEWERLDSTLNPTGKDLLTSQPVRERLQSSKEVPAMSFPAIACHDSIHDNNDDDDGNVYNKFTLHNSIIDVHDEEQPDSEPNQLSELVEGLNVEQKIKFDFLNNTAHFANFSRKDGRRTLDSREALKFALNSGLTIEKLKERYNQVSEMWLKGECRKNPLGLLHWTLTRDCDPRGLDKDEQLAVAATQAQRKIDSQRNNRLAQKGNSYIPAYGKSTTLELKTAAQDGSSRLKYGNRRVSSFGANSNYKRRKQSEVQKHSGWEALTNATENSNDEIYAAGDTATATASGSDPALPCDLKELWKSIKDDDLAGRFRLRGEDLQLLEGSRLELLKAQDGDQQAVVVLRSTLEERNLLLTTRSTIGIALRQRLGPGYRFVFKAASG